MVSPCALFFFFTSGNDGAQSAGSHLKREDASLVRKNKVTGSFSCTGRKIFPLCFLFKVKSRHHFFFFAIFLSVSNTV